MKFTPKLVPTLAAITTITLTLWLMRWQMGRAVEKQQLAATLEQRSQLFPIMLKGDETDAEELRYRRAIATGTWAPERAIFVDNRQAGGKIGFYVLVPLQLDARREVMINVGFVARDNQYPRPPAIVLPRGQARVEGLASVPSARYVELAADATQGNVWQNFDVPRYRRLTERTVAPVVVLADTPLSGLSAVTEKPNVGIEKHQGYAFQWGALSAAIFIVWIVTNVQFKPRRKSAAHASRDPQ